MSAEIQPEVLCMNLGVAITDCVPRQVKPDVWTQCAVHGPGEQKGPVSLLNRSIIYRLHPPTGDAFLVVLNGLWVDADADQPFCGLRALEAHTGAKVRFVLSPGAGHHLSLAAYATAFPEAQVCVANGRISRVNPDLIKRDNVTTYAIDAPPPELAQAGLHIEVLAGLMEGPKTRRAQFLTSGAFGYQCNTTEPLMIFHAPTGTITSGGHHWWFVPEGCETVLEAPAALRLFLRLIGLSLDYMVPGAVSCETNHTFAIHDRGAFQASCQTFMGWNFDALLDLHAPLNSCPETGAKALFEPIARPIINGDWDQVIWGQGQLPTVGAG